MILCNLLFIPLMLTSIEFIPSQFYFFWEHYDLFWQHLAWKLTEGKKGFPTRCTKWHYQHIIGRYGSRTIDHSGSIYSVGKCLNGFGSIPVTPKSQYSSSSSIVCLTAALIIILSWNLRLSCMLSEIIDVLLLLLCDKTIKVVEFRFYTRKLFCIG